ncbi:hypothetical protein N9A19_02435 [Porticoccaceae bacterium]|jgi:hypothetical protein|nr:hypothetical protein [Porticoccaceae bacterium]
MQVESGPNSFIISPAKSLLFFDLTVVALVLLMLIIAPVIFSIKLLFIVLVLWFGRVTIASFKQAQSDQLQFQPETGQWLLNGAKVYLQTQQFLTRNLLVMNLYTETGRRINQVIPIDSMPRTQHIRLRKLIIAWSKSANRDG